MKTEKLSYSLRVIYFFGIYLAFCLVHPFLSEIEFMPDDPELSATENKFIKTSYISFKI